MAKELETIKCEGKFTGFYYVEIWDGRNWQRFIPSEYLDNVDIEGAQIATATEISEEKSPDYCDEFLEAYAGNESINTVRELSDFVIWLKGNSLEDGEWAEEVGRKAAVRLWS